MMETKLDDFAKKDKVIVLRDADTGGRFLVHVDEILSIGEVWNHYGSRRVQIKLKGNNSVEVSELFETLLPFFNVMELKK